MAPIRVGIIGLSAKPAALSPGAWASTAFLPTFQNSPEYEIVALCNSSIEAACRSIEFHQLPESTRAYGNPDELADDPEVDLIVISVVVTKHLDLALPALQKRKQVFVEWPLGKTTQEAQQMTELAKNYGLQTLVGLQARGDPAVVHLKAIIESGEIGEIKSTSVLGTLFHIPPQFWVQGMEQYLDLKSGANSFHVVFGHFLDSFTYIIGDFDTNSISSILKTDTTEMAIYTPDRSKVAIPACPKTAPDHILVQGKLKSGATASINFRTTQATLDGVGIRWIITGSKGEIEVTTAESNWQAYSPSRTLKVKVFGSETRNVDLQSVDLGVAANVGRRGVNTALLLDAFAKGKQDQLAGFEAALKNHQLLDEILKKSGVNF
ncbi:oxidoreductase family protein [Colletotrichum truncatum]|uniref:Oxidoreductase family protein n=1 Tax=Colletotrichum truncatum TaxID=5467 RepID=A0ACC3ZFC5_COLTU